MREAQSVQRFPTAWRRCLLGAVVVATAMGLTACARTPRPASAVPPVPARNPSTEVRAARLVDYDLSIRVNPATGVIEGEAFLGWRVSDQARSSFF